MSAYTDLIHSLPEVMERRNRSLEQHDKGETVTDIFYNRVLRIHGLGLHGTKGFPIGDICPACERANA
jgi:hypothetical protein